MPEEVEEEDEVDEEDWEDLAVREGSTALGGTALIARRRDSCHARYACLSDSPSCSGGSCRPWGRRLSLALALTRALRLSLSLGLS